MIEIKLMMLSDKEKEQVTELVKSSQFIFQNMVIPDYEDAISIATIKKFRDNLLVDIIYEALKWFAHSTCPHCQCDIRISDYVDCDDIRKWISS